MANESFIVQPSQHLTGRLRVPGDKSISHRAVILGSLADGMTEVSGFLQGEDCLATVAALRGLGVDIENPAPGRLIIHGVGRDGLAAPSADLDLGNSGTAMRLLAGVLAGQRFSTVLTGDASLRRRPMQRIITPLTQMGACIDTTAANTAPLRIHGAAGLQGIEYTLPVPSAQVKSCLLLAGLYAQGRTCITEPEPTRDHTERLLQTFGYEIERASGTVCVSGGQRLRGCGLEVPADFSSSAFFLVGASIARDARLILEGVGVNPTRTGLITLLQRMGARIELLNQRAVGAEPVADIRVEPAPLQGIAIPRELVALAIDEFPALFIAAACAEGETLVTGAEELRVKESDRIQVMATGLHALGIEAEVLADGMRIRGGRLTGGSVDSRGDHRIAMAFAMAGLRASETIQIHDCHNVTTSFPGFIDCARSAGLDIGPA